MEIAWIGTGIMGAPMARRLMRAGHHLRVFNRTPAKARPLAEEGAYLASDPADAATNAEAIFIMVSDTPDVESVVARIEPVLQKGQLVVDMSSIAPAAEREIASRLGARGIDYLDAPVSGGESGAIEGRLAIMVGGGEAAFRRALPLFEVLGQRVVWMGPAGTGQITKLANQVAVALNLEAAAEALCLAARGGLDLAKVIEAIGAGSAGSWQLNNHGPKMVARDYRAGFFVKLMRKDLRLVKEAAQELSVPLPGVAVVASMMNAAAALGHDLDGIQSVADALERFVDVK